MAEMKVTEAEIEAIKLQPHSFHQWAVRHNEAIDRPSGFEVPIVQMLNAWETYGVEHKKRQNSLIGEESVLGRWWSSVGSSILGLLHGERGNLDLGTLDAFITETMRKNGVPVDVDGEQRVTASSERNLNLAGPTPTAISKKAS
jgi:hypothetical protein